MHPSPSASASASASAERSAMMEDAVDESKDHEKSPVLAGGSSSSLLAVPVTSEKRAKLNGAAAKAQRITYPLTQYYVKLTEAVPDARGRQRAKEDWNEKLDLKLDGEFSTGRFRVAVQCGGDHHTKSTRLSLGFGAGHSKQVKNANQLLLEHHALGMGPFSIGVSYLPERESLCFTLGLLESAVESPESALRRTLPAADVAARNNVMEVVLPALFAPSPAMLNDSAAPLSVDTINQRLLNSMTQSAITAAQLPEMAVVEKDIVPMVKTVLKDGQKGALAHINHAFQHKPADVIPVPNSKALPLMTSSGEHVYYNSAFGTYTTGEITVSLQDMVSTSSLLAAHAGHGKSIDAILTALQLRGAGPHVMFCHDNPHHMVAEAKKHLHPAVFADFRIGVYAPANVHQHIVPPDAKDLPNVFWITSVEEIAERKIDLVITTWQVLKFDRSRWKKVHAAPPLISAVMRVRKRNHSMAEGAPVVPASPPVAYPAYEATLFDVQWGIAFGDEIQCVDVDRHHLALSAAAGQLRCRMRVAMSGTPAHAEKPSVMQEMFHFLGVPVLSSRAHFMALVTTPLSQSPVSAIVRARQEEVVRFLEAVFRAIGFRQSTQVANLEIGMDYQHQPLVAVKSAPWEQVELAMSQTVLDNFDTQHLLSFHPGARYQNHTPAQAMLYSHKRLINTETRVLVRIAELSFQQAEELMMAQPPQHAAVLQRYLELAAFLEAEEHKILWSAHARIRFHRGYARALAAAGTAEQTARAALEEAAAGQVVQSAVETLRQSFIATTPEVLALQGQVAQWPVAFTAVLNAVLAQPALKDDLQVGYRACINRALGGSAYLQAHASFHEVATAVQVRDSLPGMFDQINALVGQFTDEARWTREALDRIDGALCHHSSFPSSGAPEAPTMVAAPVSCPCTLRRLVIGLLAQMRMAGRSELKCLVTYLYHALAGVVKAHPEVLVALGVSADDFAAVLGKLTLATREMDSALLLLQASSMALCVSLSQSINLFAPQAVQLADDMPASNSIVQGLREQRHTLAQTRGLLDLLEVDLRREEKPLSSSKILALKIELQRILAAFPNDKCVVFVRQMSMLKLVADHLRDSPLGPHCLFDEGMHAEDTLHRFRQPGSPSILLSTFARLGVAHDVVVANHVVLACGSPIDSEARQAVARVLRYGQDKQVRVTRIVGVDTIDERCSFGLPSGIAGQALKAALPVYPIAPAIALWNVDVDGRPRFRKSALASFDSDMASTVDGIDANQSGASPLLGSFGPSSALSHFHSALAMPEVQHRLLLGGISSSHLQDAMRQGEAMLEDLPGGLLADMLRRSGRSVRPLTTKKNGDCMWDAVFDQWTRLAGAESFRRIGAACSLDLRGLVQAALDGPWIHMQAFLTEDLRGGALGRPGVFGDNTGLKLLATLLRRKINLISTLSPNAHILIEPAVEDIEAVAEAELSCSLWIAHEAERHYWSIAC